MKTSQEPGLVRPLRKAVEESIKTQIDKSYAVEKPTETSQTVSHEDAVPSRDSTITKISSSEFYQDVGRSVMAILEKRAAKTSPQFLAKKDKGKNEEDEKKKDKEVPLFVRKKEREGEEEEEEEEEEEKPKKKKKEEEEEEPKFPIFGKKPKKAD